ncbi:cell division protein FtsQ/DivIB [Conexibacter sp. DBS9H8]|uniref:cell division protein FtsQ/DivIB n=1 Tax=Conexibacter sp. DBS9H8 TaxID=2937801 RepID=UPI00200FA4D7|nr:cell division protein FtsQ/DivIB [Conexibacter sp. DBS9H8]
MGIGLLLLGGGWLWLRSSSLVAIRQVQVTGLSGEYARQIRTVLTRTARRMTTLDLSAAALKQAVAGYPDIAGVTAQLHFPHGVTIAVDETIPVAAVHSGGALVAVDAHGVLLPGRPVRGLPLLTLAPDAAGRPITAPGTLATLAVLSAAPFQMLAEITAARSDTAHGVTLQLHNGPALYFGSTRDLAAKWAAADAVLASPNSAGASYIDVTAPERPAAGVGAGG